MAKRRVTTPPALRCMGDDADEAVRLRPLQSRCWVRSKLTWVSHMDTQTWSKLAAPASQERGRWVLKC